jgi:methenyltetrahydrofolate cyclohydrolase
MIAQDSLETFLDRLASSDPTPGGGSAAAIMGAMGAALVSMVCNVSIGKKGLEAAAAELDAVRAEAERLRTHLTALIAEDVSVFDALMSAYRRPKASDEEKTQRAAGIQDCLRRATEVPLECGRACAAVIGLAQRSADLGFRGVISDAGVGALAAHTALRSAALNVYINVPTLKDRGFADAAQAEIDTLVESCGLANEAVYRTVRAKIAG